MNFSSMTQFGKNTAGKIASKNTEVNSVAVSESKVSTLDLSYAHKTTFNSGLVVPVYQSEVYPGDTFKINVSSLIRMSIPSSPTMDSPRFDFALFFIPYTQVWSNFNNLIGESYNGGSPVVVDSVPKINFDKSLKYSANDLASYMEIPSNIDMNKAGVSISALPFRAYIKLWNEWFRDENLMSLVDFSNNDNPNSDINSSSYQDDSTDKSIQVGIGLLPSCRLKDYFSTCLPFAQKGLPTTIGIIDWNKLADSMEVNSVVDNTSKPGENTSNSFNPLFYNSDNTPFVHPDGYTTNMFLVPYNGKGDNTPPYSLYSVFTGGSPAWASGVFTNLSLSAKASNSDKGSININYPNSTFDINDLRSALVLQHQKELDARAGTRYVEKLLSYWGINVNPLEIGRTLLVGSFKGNISINNVVQTGVGSAFGANSPLGSIGGVSVTSLKSPNEFTFSSSQYGLLIGVVTVRTNITYSQGLPKLFSALKNTDFYNPSFDGLGEQPVYKKELYLTDSSLGSTSPSDLNNQVFGFQQPFAHLKYKNNVASGYLSANAENNYYNLYTYQDKLTSTPTLTPDWIRYPQNALNNTLLLNSGKSEFVNDFLADFYFNVKCDRMIPAYSVPGVDRV